MKLLLSLASSLILWILMAAILVLLILLPRDIKVQRVNVTDVMSYHFTWSGYKDNIVHYVKEVKENKSLGKSSTQQPVEWELAHYGLRSVIILVPALIISIIIGILKGVFDYRHNRGIWKLFGEGSTWLGQAIPDFFVIIILELLISLTIQRFFPQLQLYGYSHWYSIFLPIIFLSMYPAAVIAGYTTQALKEEDNRDYILTAKAKGLPERVILWKHILRNCWSKILLHFMPLVLTLLSSMVLVEYMTLYRGMGTRLIEAIQIKDMISSVDTILPIETATIIGFSLGFMLILLMAQWLNQIIKHFLNPIRKEEQS
ncbi:ABC transporter permease subunit [Bacillus sp. FJAT-49736]|uniref:ABC transporter permease subunit n=1 Tax=Bacillus sp. FJAT-49736 TaxID=2833582 RepID=UPI001BC9D73B|nr:ABC transporter permease subunit [Bacillus sp. FJAT-49736]MBS4171758.1 ABC transporter permease subunit [Bacillus sp. FJAT-49736]